MSTKQKKKSKAKSSKRSTEHDSHRKVTKISRVNFHVFQWMCHSQEVDLEGRPPLCHKMASAISRGISVVGI